MSISPRRPGPRKRRNVNLRQQQRVFILSLAALALAIAIAATLVRRPEPPIAESPGALSTATPPVIPTSQPVSAGATTSPPGSTGATAAVLPAVPAGPTDDFFHPQRFSYEPDFYQPQIQAFLDSQPGPLKSVRFQVGDRSQSFAEMLVGMSNLLNLNPKIFLALAEQQSHLISTAQPSPDQVAWAMGYQGEGGQRRGLFAQVRWAGREVRWAVRDYAGLYASNQLPELVFADGARQPPPPGISLTRYAMSRVLASTTTADQLPAKLNAFFETYSRLFGDPRLAPDNWPGPAAPFLSYPLEKTTIVTSFFDHDAPFLQQNGSLLTYWGRAETDIAFAYDGHTGWDYGAKPPDAVLAAAEGTVVFAGNSEDGCAIPARAVIIDHAHGYRTLYWHLDSIDVQTGQQVARGAKIGVAGSTGCAYGPHLHFQVQFLGRDVDPYGWCGANPDPWQASPAGQKSVWLWSDRPNPCGPPAPDMIVVDESSPGFSKSGDWQANSVGYGGGSLYAATLQGAIAGQPWQLRSLDTPAVAAWRPTLPKAGRYRVMAYIPYALSGLVDSQQVRYLVRYQGGEATVTVNVELDRNSWADLGTYEFDPSGDPMVSLSSLAGDAGTSVWADAVVWVPVP